MSLICVRCGKIIVLSMHKDHYGICHECYSSSEGKPSEEERAQIEESGKRFHEYYRKGVEK